MSITQPLSPPPARRQGRAAPARETLIAIGDLAREFNVTLRTLRFYEAKGLLKPYRDGSARLYRSDDRVKLARILEGKKLGFTLGEIRDLIARTPSAAGRGALPLDRDQIHSQIVHLERQRANIDDAIAQLKAAHEKLATLG
jgi:DNA-binding transcriptional MerR regulator